MQKPCKIAYFLSHPIQYQSPLLRKIHQDPEIALTVYYQAVHSTTAFFDPGFQQTIQWDTELCGGYTHHVLHSRLQLLSAFYHLIREKPDIVWVHGYASPFACLLITAAKLCNIRVLLRGESTLLCQTAGRWRNLFRRFFFKTLGRWVDGYLYIGTQNKAFYKHYNVPSEKCFFCPYTIDNTHFEKKPDNNTLKKIYNKLGIDPQSPIILFSSKLQQRKRVLDLVRAYQLYRDKYHSKTIAQLIIIGVGEEHEVLHKFLAPLKQNSIHAIGFVNQSELPNYYAIADIFVLPSRSEPWGLAINEAMAAGCAILVSHDVGAAQDLVQENGLCFQGGNINDLAEKLSNLLEDKKALQQMQLRSLQIIQTWSYTETIAGLKKAIARTQKGHRAWQNQKS